MFISYCGNRFLGSIRTFHSLHQFKQKKPIYRNVRKSQKSVDKDHVEPKIYMRDIITNISKILRYSTWDSAKEHLENLSLKWDSYTINQVLKTHPPMEKAWLFFHWASGIKGFKHDQFTYTTMLDIFGEAKRVSSMKYVFQQMQEKGIRIDAVTYTSVMHWLSNCGDVDGSVKMWNEMKSKGCRPTVVSYTAFMKILFDSNRAKDATELYKEMLRSGCSPNCHTYTVLMEHLVVSGKSEAALEIFNKMQEAGVQPDKATCNILIEKCCKTGETQAMTPILQYMKHNFLVLRYPVFLQALRTLKLSGESDQLLRQVHPHITTTDTIELTFEPPTDINFFIDQELILYLLAKKNFITIDYITTTITEKKTRFDSFLVSRVIEANCANSRPSGALLAFDYSLKTCVRIRKEAYLSLIGLFIRMNSFPKVVEIVEEMVKARFFLGSHMGSLLIYKLGCVGNYVSASQIFDLLLDEHKTVATYTALIGAYFSCGNVDKGLEIYASMRSKGIRSLTGTYNVLIVGLEKCDRFYEAEMYRKEKKSLQNYSPSMEEKICDLLFAGDI